jgi:uncharacterized protein (DUF305 family)
MCGSTSGCGSPYTTTSKKSTIPKTLLQTEIDDMFDDLIDHHRKSIDLISKLKAKIKTSDDERIKEIVKQLTTFINQ